jgi:phage-related baseplate assembly protein
MSISAENFTGVDLSRLPPPTAVEELDFETLRTQWLDQFLALALDAGLTSYSPTDSDPIVKLIEAAAYREMVWRASRNAGLRAVMAAYAIGADLDHIAALFGVERYVLTPANTETGTPAVLESDDDFRRRMVLAPEGFSVAGPRGAYIFHTLSADNDVLDASAISPTPGQVVVTVLSRTGTGVPSSPVLAAVTAALSAEDVRPITDQVTVQAATIVNFAISATLTYYLGPDKSVVTANAMAALNAYLSSNRRLGRSITRAGIIGAIMVEGLQNVVLASPAADLPFTSAQAGNCTSIAIADGGYA